MALDNFKNNGKVTVSLGYDAAAVSIVLQAGDAAKLPTAPFNAEWWDSTTYTDPTDDPNKEIIRVTTVTSSNDTLTIVRAAETSAFTHNTAGKIYKLVVGLTAKTLNTDIPATYTAYNATMTTSGGIPYVTGAGTITEDATNLFWDGTNVGIGTNTMAGKIHVVSTGSGAGVGIIADAYASQAQVLLRRGNGSGGGPTALSSGDLVARYGMQGYNGAAFTARKAAIEMNAAENWGTASNGAYISIQTTPKGSTSIAEVVRITDVGFVGIGTATPAGPLHVIGNAPTIIADGTTNPQYRIYNNGTFEAAIAVPTAAGNVCADAAVNDLVIRSQAGNLIETVDAGISVRREVRFAKTLTSTATQTTTMFTVLASNNSIVAGNIYYSVESIDTVNHKMANETGIFGYVFGQNNGTGITTSITSNKLAGFDVAGDQTVTWSIVNSVAGTAVITCAIVTFASPTSVKITTTIENFGRQAITPS